jgi:hypothetical protein
MEKKSVEKLFRNIQKVNEDRDELFVKQKKEKTAVILEIIMLYSIRNGITNNEFSELMGMNRKSLTPYLSELKKNLLMK